MTQSTAMQQLGAVFFQRRQQRKLSRAAVAYEMSQGLGERVDQSYVADLEAGNIARPDKARLKWMAVFFEVAVAEALRAADYPVDDEDETMSRGDDIPLDVREAVRGLNTVPPNKRQDVLDLIRRIVTLQSETDSAAG